MNVFCLGADQIDPLWDELAPHLYRLERTGCVSAQEIREALCDMRMQAWGLQEGPKVVGVAVTKITGNTCEVVGGAGSAPYDAMRELHREIETWARTQGCQRMRLMGRKGWLKLLNYTQTGIVAEKEL